MGQQTDWLRESAKAFAKLKNIRYDLIVAYAGKLVKVSIGFDNSDAKDYTLGNTDSLFCIKKR